MVVTLEKSMYRLSFCGCVNCSEPAMLNHPNDQYVLLLVCPSAWVLLKDKLVHLTEHRAHFRV